VEAEGAVDEIHLLQFLWWVAALGLGVQCWLVVKDPSLNGKAAMGEGGEDEEDMMG